jgi:hypothetical protein
MSALRIERPIFLNQLGGKRFCALAFGVCAIAGDQPGDERTDN